VFDFKDPKVNPDVMMMFVNISAEDFKLTYKDDTDTHFYVKHKMKTFIPSCDTLCSDADWFSNKMGKLSPEVRKRGVSDIHYSDKQLKNALVKVNKFGVAGLKCGVVEFEEIGT
jgi:hypothetical protein